MIRVLPGAVLLFMACGGAQRSIELPPTPGTAFCGGFVRDANRGPMSWEAHWVSDSLEDAAAHYEVAAGQRPMPRVEEGIAFRANRNSDAHVVHFVPATTQSLHEHCRQQIPPIARTVIISSVRSSR